MFSNFFGKGGPPKQQQPPQPLPTSTEKISNPTPPNKQRKRPRQLITDEEGDEEYISEEGVGNNEEHMQMDVLFDRDHNSGAGSPVNDTPKRGYPNNYRGYFGENRKYLTKRPKTSDNIIPSDDQSDSRGSVQDPTFQSTHGGLYDHIQPYTHGRGDVHKRKTAGHYKPHVSGVGARGLSAASAASVPLINSDDETDLNNEIGLMVTPTAEGTIFINKFDEAIKDNAKDAKAKPHTLKIDSLRVEYELGKLRDILTDWNIDIDARERYIDSIIKTHHLKYPGIPEPQRVQIIQAILDKIVEMEGNVEKRYNREWVNSEILRVRASENHPFVIFAQMVATKRKDKQLMSFMYKSIFDHFIPQLVASIEDRANTYKGTKRQLDVASETFTNTDKQLKEFRFGKDNLFSFSMPTTGIDVKELQKALRLYLENLKALESDPKKGLNKIILEHSKMYNLGLSAMEGFRSVGTPFESFDTSGQGRNSLNIYEKILKDNKLIPDTALKRYLELATQIFTNGTVGTFSTRLGKFEQLATNLSLTGELVRFMKEGTSIIGLPKYGQTVDALSKKENRPTFENRIVRIGGIHYYRLFRRNNVKGGTEGELIKTTRFLDQSEKTATVTEFYMPLSPYTIGLLSDASSSNESYMVSSEVGNYYVGDTSMLEFLDESYKEIDETVLNNITGKWRFVQLTLEKNPKKDGNSGGGAGRPSPLVDLGISTFLEYLRDYISTTSIENPDSIPNEMIVFIESFSSGRSLSELITLAKDVYNRSYISKGGTKKKEISILFDMLTILNNWLSTNPKKIPIDQIETTTLTFPLQYHVDYRFTLLYVLMQYELVRLVILDISEYFGNILAKQNKEAANRKLEKQREYDTIDTRKSQDIVDLARLMYTTLPINSGNIVMPLELNVAILSAWGWIVKHAVHVNWNSEEAKNYSAYDIIIDMSNNDVEALILKDLLADVVAMHMASPDLKNTTALPNTSTESQIERGIRNITQLRKECLRLRGRVIDLTPANPTPKTKTKKKKAKAKKAKTLEESRFDFLMMKSSSSSSSSSSSDSSDDDTYSPTFKRVFRLYFSNEPLSINPTMGKYPNLSWD